MGKIIKRRVLISMIFLGFVLMGVFSWDHLSMELFPNAELPELRINVSSSNEYDPIYVESKAVIPVEGAISSMEGVESIESRVTTRGASITVSFLQNVDLKYAYLQVEERIKTVSASIPEEFSVSVSKSGGGMASSIFMTLSVLSDEDIDFVRNVTDEDIVPKLENLDGIAAVTAMGGRSKSIEIIVDPDKCESIGTTMGRIASLIQSNIAEKTFAGTVYEGKNRYFVNVAAEYLSTEDLGDIVVAQGPVLLKDIAEINFGVKEEESYSRINGQEVISVNLSKSQLANVIDLSHEVRAEIAKLNTELASRGVSIEVNVDTAETMQENIDSIINLALTGALLAIFVLFIFLRNWRVISVISFSIPISVLSAFYFFYLFGISINTLTLTGIALAIGMLLDNSVVVMENIYRLRAQGMDNDTSCVRGVKEVTKAITASTVTTITVFLPFLFTDNYMIKLIGEHVGVSIVSTLLISLLVSLFLIPMAMNWLLERASHHKSNFSNISSHNRLVQIYTALLKTAMRAPAQVITYSMVVLALVVVLTLTLTLNTLNEVEEDTFELYLTPRSGSSLDKTDALVRNLEEAILDIEEIEKFSSNVFAEDARMTLTLADNYEKMNNKTLDQLKNLVVRTARNFRFAEVSLEAIESSTNFQGSSGVGGGNADLMRLMGMGTQSEKVLIKGQDFEKMVNFAEFLKYQIDELDNVNSSRMSASQGNTEANIYFDQYQMGVNSVTLQNVSQELSNFAPQSTINVNYKSGDDEYEIVIRDVNYDEEDETTQTRTLDELRTLDVNNSEGAVVELRSFSRINLAYGRGNINRVNQEKEVTVTYSFTSDVNDDKDLLEAARDEIDEVVGNMDIPTDIAVEVIHEENELEDFSFLIFAAVVLIFMILASVFESLVNPLVVMFSIPLAAIGSLLGLLFTHNSFLNANVLIGFVILIGIVINNSIILIDCAKHLRDQGYSRERAIMTAGLSRLRPILITALTTIVAMLPLALGDSEMSAGLGAPFAITVVGGMITSTLLTLVVIPTLYAGMEDVLKRMRTQRLFMKILQITLLVACVALIFILEEGLWLRILYLLIACILIPAVTWFLEGSLRQARSTIVPENEDIVISIRNLVKIYGRPGRFAREIESGKKIRERLGLKTEYRTWNDLVPLVWLLPIAGFLYYFVFVYQEIFFWAVLFCAVAWLMTVSVLDMLRQFNQNRNHQLSAKVWSFCIRLFYYAAPLLFLIMLQKRFDAIGGVVISGLVWYLLILAKRLSDKLNREKINIDLIDGRFRTTRKALYRLASKLPFIGAKPKPFRALSAVSFDIHTGMFGLLGPNGAGKTTLMRIVCGIFEQSYGKIFINGIDTQKKREELQGLIGYLPQEFGTYENMTAQEFLEYQALLKGIYDKKARLARVHEVLSAVHMIENKDKRIGGFSGGMKQRIGIAQTLLNLPRILVVDEPTAGLDPRERIRFRNLLVELSRNRVVIFSTHIIEDIASSCNQVGVINKGELKYLGNPTEMADIAANVTWSFEISLEEFEKLPAGLLIVHHIRIGDVIRVRCLSDTQPFPGARQIQPSLEDSYLWLLHGVKMQTLNK